MGARHFWPAKAHEALPQPVGRKHLMQTEEII